MGGWEVGRGVWAVGREGWVGVWADEGTAPQVPGERSQAAYSHGLLRS